MARPASFNKKDNEKKKQSKRLEKQKKKEIRKTAEKGKGFEDMIAYVDENGMIIDTPPETKREEINIEDIEISVRRREDEPLETSYQGKVDHFNQAKGYGFIKEQEKGEKYFFHISNSPANIAEGNVVSFELQRGARGMEVINIKILK